MSTLALFEEKQVRRACAAKAGGTVAGNARKELETQSGTRVSTPANFKALTEGMPKALPRRKPKVD